MADFDQGIKEVVELYQNPKMLNGITSERILHFTIFIKNGILNIVLPLEKKPYLEESMKYFNTCTNNY